MFYGLSKFIKQLLPKQLFYRGLLIVALPIIILQVTISIVFFDSLWIKTNIGMTRALVGEIKTFIDSYNREGADKNFVEKTFEEYLDIDVVYFQNKEFSDLMSEKWYSPIDRSLRRELKSKNLIYWFDTSKFKNIINLKIQNQDDYFEFFIPRERLTSTSVRIFALWITLPAILMIAIAIIFLKNQTRPIIKLAEASERFGRGEDIDEFRPSGALEIRKAGLEFEKMRNRIQRHLNQRSEMLSGISHDLRTPLTRIKLQLAIIKDKALSEKLSDDVNEMEKMLNEYLQFASTGAKEKTENFDLSELLESLIGKYDNHNISKEFKKNIYFNGRKNLIQRCINNLIDNSIKYGEKTKIIMEKKLSNIKISIEDDGPGIPKSEHKNVIKPFYKIDKSRSETKSSVGLGLAISSDIIKSHGGDMTFSKSNLGGLKVMISLPV